MAQKKERARRSNERLAAGPKAGPGGSDGDNGKIPEEIGQEKGHKNRIQEGKDDDWCSVGRWKHYPARMEAKKDNSSQKNGEERDLNRGNPCEKKAGKYRRNC